MDWSPICSFLFGPALKAVSQVSKDLDSATRTYVLHNFCASRTYVFHNYFDSLQQLCRKNVSR